MSDAIRADALRKPGGALSYMPQLDGLRAMGITMVLVAHYGLFDGFEPVRIKIRQFGNFGLDTFFVMSGYLITGILLRLRARMERRELTPLGAFRLFYMRRSLRVFPIYYIALVALALIGVPVVAEYAGWLVSYTINWPITRPAHLFPVAHFWSLAVEEQFYLVWPALILLLPRRAMLPAIGLISLVSILLRLWLWDSGAHAYAIRMNTLACLDFMGLGAFLSMAEWDPGRYGAWRSRLRKPALVIGLAGAAWCVANTNALHDPRYHALSPPFHALLAFWLVDRGARDVPYLFGRLLTLRPVVAWGRVSYGIYIYHFPLLWLWVQYAADFRWANHPGVRFAVLVTASGLLAFASWRWVEKPFNDLKDRFPYR